MANSLLSAKVIREVHDHCKERLRDIHSDLGNSLMQDGVPPMHQLMSERQQWEKLAGMRAMNDPRFWTDPRAMQDWEKLAQRFGNPPLRQELQPAPQLPPGPRF